MAFLLAFPKSPGAAVFKVNQSKIILLLNGRVCCIVLLLTCLCPYLLMNASVEGHPDIFKFLSIMNRAVLLLDASFYFTVLQSSCLNTKGTLPGS